MPRCNNSGAFFIEGVMIEFKLNKEKEREILFAENYYLWRFVDIHKLFHFILNQEIVFSRFDCFNDPLEGLSLEQINHLDHLSSLPDKKAINPELGKDIIQQVLTARKSIPFQTKQYQRSQKVQFASCWYKNNSQSWAMWNQYSNNEGFAIRINGKHLLERLSVGLNLYHLRNKNVDDAMIGIVEYLPLWPFDRRVTYKDNNRSLYSGFKKDLSYTHENELRFIVVLNKIKRNKNLPLKMPIDSDLDIKIFANPKMDSWKFETFRCLMKKLNFNLNLVEKSELPYRKFKP